jgi:hypothetical protein
LDIARARAKARPRVKEVKEVKEAKVESQVK